MILFSDGFDKYSDDQDLLSHWTNVNTSIVYAPTEGVRGGGAMKFNQDDVAISTNFAPVENSGIRKVRIAFWFKSTIQSDDYIMRLVGKTAGNTNRYHMLRTTAGGVFYLTTSDASYAVTTLYNGNINVCDGDWHFIEILIDNTDHNDWDAWIKIDGVLDLVLPTGPVTSYDANGDQMDHMYRIDFFGTNGASTWLDDVLVWDDTGGPDAFTGELDGAWFIHSSGVDGAGTHSDGTPVGAATNHEAVDEGPYHDGDISYNSLVNIGDKDTFTVEDLPANVTDIRTVLPKVVGSAQPAATVTLGGYILSGATSAQTANKQLVSDHKRTVFGEAAVDPNTGAAWTPANFNAAEFGYEKIA